VTSEFTSIPPIPRNCHGVVGDIHAVYFLRQKEPMDYGASFGNEVLPVDDQIRAASTEEVGFSINHDTITLL
jgi:hypothetical protein